MPSIEEIFRSTLKLVGSDVVIERVSAPAALRGTVRAALFDSLLLESGSQRCVVAYSDIRALVPLAGSVHLRSNRQNSD